MRNTMIVTLVALGVGCAAESEKPKPQPSSVDISFEKKNPSSSKVSSENFLKIQTDMPKEDVLLILGPPTNKKHENSVYEWIDGNKTITVVFGDKIAGQITSPTVVKNKWHKNLN